MITINRLRLRAGHKLHLWQARRLLARINRRQANAARPASPGYDELSNPVFIGVMALALVVLVMDVADAWPQVEAAVLALASLALTAAIGA